MKCRLEMRLALVCMFGMSCALSSAARAADVGNFQASSPPVEDDAAGDTVARHLGRLKAAEPDAYDDRIQSVLAASDQVEDLLKQIRKGMTPQPDDERKGRLKAGWTEWEATDAQGTTRPYQLYLPPSVLAGKSPSAVVVHIHGAVARPDFGRGPGNAAAVGYAGFLWPKLAKEHDLVIVCPAGRADCTWWTDNGVAHIQAVLRDVKRSLSIPDQSIFAAGFSDGGSGCYYLSMASPDPFAGFIAMNGHPAVAATASGKQLYLRNMAVTPLIAAMTQEDSLYPSRTVLPHVTSAIAEGAPITVISYPNVNHQPLYFNDQTTTIVNFLKNTKRNDQPDRIRWLTADTGIGTVRWAEILELGATERDAPALEAINLMTTPGRLTLGIQLARSSTEVLEVVEASPAAGAGMQAGDVIVELDGTAVTDTRSLRRALQQQTHGNPFTCVVKRDGQEATLQGTFPTFVAEPLYRRDNETAHIDCRLSSDATPQIRLSSRHVKRLRIWLPDGLGDHEEIELAYGPAGNLATRSLTVQRLSASELLARFAKHPDVAIRASYVDVEL